MSQRDASVPTPKRPHEPATERGVRRTPHDHLVDLRSPAGLREARSQIDMHALRTGRLQRLRGELERLGYGACVLLDPLNMRYATGSRNMQVFMLRNPARYAFVPVVGPVIVFDFPGCEHLVEGLETVDEVREAITVSFVSAGNRLQQTAGRWADEIADLVRRYGGGRRVAVDRMHAAAVAALDERGVAVVDGQEPVERARATKSPEELACIRVSLGATELGMSAMRGALRPGMTENELWAHLHHTNIELGGDYIETRLLTSGPKTNPWFQECGDRVIDEGDLVAFDTDVNGPFGYYADISRTFHCGDRPTSEQRRLYQLSYEQVQTNLAALEPGLSFREYASRCWTIPPEFYPQRYFVVAHGVGLSGEYPYITHREDFDDKGYDGMIEPGMVLCLESYIGAVNGGEGVKLEEQVLVTENGVEVLSTYPFESALLD